MKPKDVMLARVYGSDGQPLYASGADMRGSVEALWSVTQGARSRVCHPFTTALNVAMKWAAQTDGQIYRQDGSEEPTLFVPSA